MNDLFFSLKALAIRLVFLVLACFIAVDVTALFSLHSPWSFINGLVWGGLSQIVAMSVLSRDAI